MLSAWPEDKVSIPTPGALFLRRCGLHGGQLSDRVPRNTTGSSDCLASFRRALSAQNNSRSSARTSLSHTVQFYSWLVAKRNTHIIIIIPASKAVSNSDYNVRTFEMAAHLPPWYRRSFYVRRVVARSVFETSKAVSCRQWPWCWRNGLSDFSGRSQSFGMVFEQRADGGWRGWSWRQTLLLNGVRWLGRLWPDGQWTFGGLSH